MVQFLSDCLPIEVRKLLNRSYPLLFLNDDSEQCTLLCTPWAVAEVCFANAEPLEHAVTASHPRNQLGHSLPILHVQLLLDIADALLVAVLADYPYQYPHIFFAPVLLQFFVLDHLVDAGGGQPQHCLITDVTAYHFLVLVELLTVG